MSKYVSRSEAIKLQDEIDAEKKAKEENINIIWGLVVDKINFLLHGDSPYIPQVHIELKVGENTGKRCFVIYEWLGGKKGRYPIATIHDFNQLGGLLNNLKSQEENEPEKSEGNARFEITKPSVFKQH